MKDEQIRFCTLRNREVINVCDCKRLGYVTDVIINLGDGKIEAIVLPGPGKACGLFGYDSEYVIPYKCITRIGNDIIFVTVEEEKILKNCQ